MTMFQHNEYHLLRRVGKVPIDKGWIDNPLTAQAYNDHRALSGDFGLVCGSRGIYVLDIDTDKATGEIRPETLDILLSLDLPETLKVTTPSGGCHYFFHSNSELPGRSIKLAPGIDWLGKGGYVALYEPLDQYDPDMINGLPESVLDLIRKPERVPVIDLTVVEGNRNDSLYRYGCGLAGQGVKAGDLGRALWAENQGYKPPLERNEVVQIYEQVCKYITEEPAVEAEPASLIMSRNETLALELPKIEQMCGALYSSGVLMIAGQAGVGKSLFVLNLAASIAAGQDFSTWQTPKACKVLYVDGEMATQYMQARLDHVPDSDNLGLVHLESMRRCNGFVDFGKQTWRDYFLRSEIFDQYELFVFDTVSSLLLPNNEIALYDPEYWLQLESWHQQFRAKGKTVVWVDNLNKAGEIFGTSVKHHKADAVWNFEVWKDCPYTHKAAFKMTQGKLRGDSEEASGGWYFHPQEGWKCTL